MVAGSPVHLLSPWEHPNGLTFKNRVIMAPLTRGRANEDRIPKQIGLEYYVARASAGLITTEGASFCDTAHGWAQSAAVQTQEQVDAWKKIVTAVHEAGGLISCQLWHTGRASDSSYQKGGSLPVAPSAIAIPATAHRKDGSKKPYETPRALTIEEIGEIVQAYQDAAKRCKEAGFDMIEVHNANGYLLDTFLQSCSNKRTDKYGGSLENRFRFTREVLEAVTQVYPANRVSIRFSPNGEYNGMGSEDNIEAYNYFISETNKFGLGFLHIMDGLAFGYHKKTEEPYTLDHVRKIYDHPVMANCGYTQETAEAAVSSGRADAVSFGRPFLSNPDLVEKFKTGAPLAPELPFKQWYSPGPEGYVTGLPEAPNATVNKEEAAL